MAARAAEAAPPGLRRTPPHDLPLLQRISASTIFFWICGAAKITTGSIRTQAVSQAPSQAVGSRRRGRSGGRFPHRRQQGGQPRLDDAEDHGRAMFWNAGHPGCVCLQLVAFSDRRAKSSMQKARHVGATRLYLVTPPVSDPAAFRTLLDAALQAGDVACLHLRIAATEAQAAKKRFVQALAPTAQERGAARADRSARGLARGGAAGRGRRPLPRSGPGGGGAGGDEARQDRRRRGPQVARRRHVGREGRRRLRDVRRAAGDGTVPPADQVVERCRWWAELFNTHRWATRRRRRWSGRSRRPASSSWRSDPGSSRVQRRTWPRPCARRSRAPPAAGSGLNAARTACARAAMSAARSRPFTTRRA